MLLSLLLALSAGPPAPRVDLYGDPLPPGAIARLGTIRFRHGSPITGVAVSGDGKTVASCAADHTVRNWDRKTGRQLAVLGAGKPEAVGGPTRWIHTVAISSDGTRAASLANDGVVHCYDTATGKKLWSTPMMSPEFLGRMVFSPDGGLVVGVVGQSVFRLNAKTGMALPRLWGENGTLGAITFSPDGKLLATGAANGAVTLYQTDGWKAQTVVRKNGMIVQSLAFSPDSKRLAASGGHNLVIYQVAPFKQALKVELKEEGRRCIFLPEDKQVLTVGEEPSPLRLWDASTGKLAKTVEHPLGWVSTIALCPDGRTAVLNAAGRSTVFQIDVKTGKVAGPWPGHTGPIRQPLL